MNRFIIASIFLLILFSISSSQIEKDPFTMEVNKNTTETMRLMKIRAAGLLPQMNQKLLNNRSASRPEL